MVSSKLLFLAVIAAVQAIDVDVAVVGGGGSGGYAAVQLRENYGKKIVVIEKQKQLGGHAQSWYDPVTGKAYNYGVDAFTNITVSIDFFKQLKVPIGPVQSEQVRNLYVDFKDGKTVDFTPPTTKEAADAMGNYRDQWLKYTDILLPTSEHFPRGDKVPSDLLLSWYEFARKYKAEAASPSIWDTVVVDLNTALMIDVWKAWNPSVGSFQPASGDNTEIWQKAAKLLGKDVLYEKLEVFHSAAGNRYYTGIVSHPSLPAAEITNVVPAAINENYLAYPTVPFQAYFHYKGNSSTGPIHRALAIVPRDTSIEDAKDLIRKSLQNLIDAGTILAGNSTDLDFRTFSDHGLLYRHWSADQLRGGIFAKANALQGQRSTWYTGAFWMNNDCVMLWNTTNAILKEMLKDI
ncbi:Beta-cyclopiazonate dehydrogenase [Fusarium oxysporum f. sp. cubense]|uniref:Beta-cyclopiazonate dehydrogenase n=1 Tax=Fusarium oxysporum f. sp. cubense TaxID=61366 RepID=A0A559L6U0_FUSOC|nr:Beta-cyclopiazonate dehydrogenase [Fusarium oxysporum f. sp. cubense]